MARNSSSARCEMKRSATPALVPLRCGALLRDEPFHVGSTNPAARLALVPKSSQDFNISLAHLAALLPKSQCVADHFARRGIFAVLDGETHRVGHGCGQGDAQAFDLGHDLLLDPSIARTMKCYNK